MVLEKLHCFSLITISPLSSKQGFGMRVNRSIHATSNFYLSLPVTLGSRLSKDCQTELVNLCQGRDYMIFTVQLEKEPSLLSIYPARQQLSIIFCFVFKSFCAVLSETGNQCLPSDSFLRSSKVIKPLFKQNLSSYYGAGNLQNCGIDIG